MIRVIPVNKKPTDCEKRDRVPVPPGRAQLLSNCHLVDSETGETLALHAQLSDPPEIIAPIRKWLRSYKGWADAGVTKIESSSSSRLSGIKNANTTFGTAPAVPLRRKWGASPSRLNQEYPAAGYALEELGAACARYFKENLPKEWEQHTALEGITNIHDGWKFRDGEVPWTSGIINKTAALPYHKDAGNVPGSWSAMVVLRKNIDGGHLHIPEIDVWLACNDLSISIFRGRDHLHGVTPFQARNESAYRYSIVYYAKTQLQKALAPGEEIKQAERRATKSADDVVKGD